MNNVRLSTFPITSSVAFTLTRILPIPRTYSRHCREFSHEHDSKIRLKRASTSEAIENDVASSLLFNSKTRLHNSFLRSDDRSGYSVSRVITEDCRSPGPRHSPPHRDWGYREFKRVVGFQPPEANFGPRYVS